MTDDRVALYAGGDPDFETWLGKVNDHVEDIIGLGLFDLADVPLYDWYEDEVDPYDAAVDAIEEDGGI